MITKREAAIISAYTGVCLGNFEDVKKYAEELFGNPKWANDFPDEEVMGKLQEKAKADFEALKVKQSKKPNE